VKSKSSKNGMGSMKKGTRQRGRAKEEAARAAAVRTRDGRRRRERKINTVNSVHTQTNGRTVSKSQTASKKMRNIT